MSYRPTLLPSFGELIVMMGVALYLLLALSVVAAIFGVFWAGLLVVAFVVYVVVGSKSVAAKGSAGECEAEPAGRGRPQFTYVTGEPPDDLPYVVLQAGQEATMRWPHGMRIGLPEGVTLQVLQADSEVIRVRAVRTG